MSSAVDLLEARVVAAVDLIDRLRTTIRSLERELSTMRESTTPCPDPSPASPGDPALVAEIERLRAERVAVREGIRGLLREIDRVAW
jgi:FtsZ-binding cell division protein ZapB